MRRNPTTVIQLVPEQKDSVDIVIHQVCSQKSVLRTEYKKHCMKSLSVYYSWNPMFIDLVAYDLKLHIVETLYEMLLRADIHVYWFGSLKLAMTLFLETKLTMTWNCLSFTHFKPAVGIFLACQRESLEGEVYCRQGPGFISYGCSATPTQRLFFIKPM